MVLQQTHSVLLHVTKMHHHTAQKELQKGERIHKSNKNMWQFTNVLYGSICNYRIDIPAKYPTQSTAHLSKGKRRYLTLRSFLDREKKLRSDILFWTELALCYAQACFLKRSIHNPNKWCVKISVNKLSYCDTQNRNVKFPVPEFWCENLLPSQVSEGGSQVPKGRPLLLEEPVLY